MRRWTFQPVQWTWRFFKRHRVGLMISSVVCILSLGLYVPVYFVPQKSAFFVTLRDLELKTLDLRFRLRGPLPPSSPIVIVTIDQKSQDVLGRWPFPRSRFAQALNALKDAGAKVVAFDVAFPQPDENSALEAMKAVRKDYEAVAGGSGSESNSFAAKLKSLESSADNDQQFADALSRFDNAILGYFCLYTTEETASQNAALVNDFLNYLSFQAYPQVIHPENGRKFGVGCEYCDAIGVEPDLPKLAQYAKNFGFYNVIPDPDGVVRREPVIIRYQGNYYPSLDVASAMAYTNLPLDQIAVFFNPNGLERIDFGTRAIPTDPEGEVQIDFHGPANTYPWISLADVVQAGDRVSVTQIVHGKRSQFPSPRSEVFRNKIVLIGPTATGIADTRPTPFETTAFPGVEVHANFIDNLLTGHFILRGLQENLVDIGFILLFSLAAGVLLSVLPATRATAVVVVFLGLFLWLAYYLFASRRIWIAVFLPSSTLTLNYGAIISYRFFFEEREKKKVRSTFGQYVSPGVVNLLLTQPDQLRLGGEKKELTAMFSDIRGFTALSEGLTPEALVALLNEYLSDMTEVIFRNWGTLDKYIGDAIMAFWGWPYHQEDHAERACRAALEMLQALKKLQERWRVEGRSSINIGVGINTGAMVVGNMGSKNRKNITIMGDDVNLASRLEGINKEFGTRLVISESTRQAAGKMLVTRELDLIRVKGKTKPVRIFELLGMGGDAGNFRDLLARFQIGLEEYRIGEFQSAAEVFDKLVHDYPQDNPSRIFFERCNDLILQPPEGVWDGVFTMTHK